MGVAAKTDAIREGYNKWSAVYDHDRNPLVALEEPLVHNLIAPPRKAVRSSTWDAAQAATRFISPERGPR